MISGQLLMVTYLGGFIYLLYTFLVRISWPYRCVILPKSGSGVFAVDDRAKVVIKKDGTKEWKFKKFNRKFPKTPIPDGESKFPIQNFFREKVVMFLQTANDNLIALKPNWQTSELVVDKYNANAVKMTIASIVNDVNKEYSPFKDKLLMYGLPLTIMVLAIVFASVITIMTLKGNVAPAVQAVQNAGGAFNGVIPGG